MKVEDTGKPMATQRPPEELEQRGPVQEDEKCASGQFTCLACREARIYCEKTTPCARCVRLNIQCVPQNRGRGRPRGNTKKARRQVNTKNAAVDNSKARDAKKKLAACGAAGLHQGGGCSSNSSGCGPQSPVYSDDSSCDSSTDAHPCYHSYSHVEHEEDQWTHRQLPSHAQPRVAYVQEQAQSQQAQSQHIQSQQHAHSQHPPPCLPPPFLLPPAPPPPITMQPQLLPTFRDPPCVVAQPLPPFIPLARPVPVLDGMDDGLRRAYSVCAGAIKRLLDQGQLDFDKANLFRDGLHLHFEIYSGFNFSGEALRSMLETCRAEYNRRPRGPPTRLLMPGDAVSIAESAADSAWVVDLLSTSPSALTMYLRSSLRGARSDRQVWCNERMSEVVMSSRELCAATIQLRTTIMHVLTRVLHPSTQDGFFVGLTEAMFSPGRAERNVVVKLVDRNLRAFRCLVTIRAVLHCYPGDTETAIRFLPLQQLVTFGQHWTEVGAVEKEMNPPGQWGSVVDGSQPEGEAEPIPTPMVKGEDHSDAMRGQGQGQDGNLMVVMGSGAEYVEMELPPQLTGSMDVVVEEGQDEEQFMSLLDHLGPLFDPTASPASFM